MKSGLPDSLPRLPYVVADQNILRKSAVILPLLAEYERSGQQILLSWSAHYELSKGTVGGLRRSLELLAQNPDAVSVAFESFALSGLHERRFRKPVRDVIDHGSTANVREVLRLVASGEVDDPAFVQVFTEVQRRARAEMARHDSDGLFRGTVQSIGAAFTPEEKSRVRKGLQASPPDRQPFRDELMVSFTRSNLHSILHGCGIPYRTAHKMMRFPSLIALNVMAKLAISFRWLLNGSLDTTKQSMENEMADVENIIVALYGRGLASEDRNAVAHYEDLQYFVRQVWG